MEKTGIEKREGFERASRREYMQFLNLAKGSAGEVRYLLHVALEVGHLERAEYDELRNAAMELSTYLANRIKLVKKVN